MLGIGIGALLSGHQEGCQYIFREIITSRGPPLYVGGHWDSCSAGRLSGKPLNMGRISPKVFYAYGQQELLR